MRPLAVLLLLVPACFTDAPPVDEEDGDSSSSAGAFEESEGGSSDESSSGGEALAPLYGKCSLDADCEGGLGLPHQTPDRTGIACVADTCLAWHRGIGEYADEPCAAGEIVDGQGSDIGWELCMLGADTSTGLAVCPDSMGAVVWEYDALTKATCWNAALLSGATCTGDENCGGDTHCVGQPWYTHNNATDLPNVCR